MQLVDLWAEFFLSLSQPQPKRGTTFHEYNIGFQEITDTHLMVPSRCFKYHFLRGPTGVNPESKIEQEIEEEFETEQGKYYFGQELSIDEAQFLVQHPDYYMFSYLDDIPHATKAVLTYDWQALYPLGEHDIVVAPCPASAVAIEIRKNKCEKNW